MLTKLKNFSCHSGHLIRDKVSGWSKVLGYFHKTFFVNLDLLSILPVMRNAYRHAWKCTPLFIFALPLFGQTPWSTFIDGTRAVDWTSAGFSIPNYTVACSTVVSLAGGSGAASANATSITNALASCDSTHNVVNLPAGTYYIDAITYPSHGNQVLRGAGANSTFLKSTGSASCEGFNAGICMIDATPVYNGSSEILPGGQQAASWTAGYSQGTTSITLNSVGSTAPVVGNYILLDQANDSSDNGGVYICDENTPASCNYDGTGGSVGRVISGTTHSEIQATKITSLTSCGTNCLTVGISPAIYFTNVISGNSPGAWWPTQVHQDGLENLSIDGTADGYYTLNMYDCFNCWVKGVTFLNGARASVGIRQGYQNVIRDSYFYQAQGHGSVSYNIELNMTSANLIENNIIQQTVYPFTINNGTGNVFDYNFGTDNYAVFSGQNYTVQGFTSHGAGTTFNLFEGNNWGGQQADDAWGSTDQVTYFRNMLSGWQNGIVNNNERVPIIGRSYVRNVNIVGNILGQPATTGSTFQHSIYQTIALSNTTLSGTNEDQSVYVLGLAVTGACGTGTPQTSPFCDTKSVSTLMRWGNCDVVTGFSSCKFDSTEASPAAVTYVNANFSSSYFSTLAHTLPASLFYTSTPSWWPGGKAWPPTGPDITGGNVGICSGGTYAGGQGTLSSQCSGGTLATAWGGHVNSIPAEDCFLNIMGGNPNGSGSALAFDASTCYTGGGGTFTWTQSTVGIGTITGTNATSGTYTTGTTIGPLTATAGTGYTFTGWSGATGNATCSGTTNPCPSFTLTANSAATATFTVNSYTLSTATTGGGTGTISGCAGAHNYGTTYTCSVTPNAGVTLTGVTGCSGSGTTTYTGTMPASNCTITANFVIYTLSTATTGTGTGTVVCTPSGNVRAGTAYSCTVTPAVGSTLTAVTGCGGSGTTTYTGIMPSSSCTVSANFQGTVANVTFTPPAGSYTSAQSVVLATATPAATIRYTLDGSTPGPSSTVYTAAINIASSITLKAYATASGYTDSGVTTGVYTIASQMSAPTFSPVGGTYAGTQSVTLSASIPSIVLSATEGSNGNSSTGAAPTRNIYTNCATSCSAGVPQPPNSGPVSHGQLWCNSSQVTTCGSFGTGFVTSTISGTGTTALDNGQGTGGVDSATSVTSTFAAANANGCPVGTNILSVYQPGLTLPGNVTAAHTVYGATTGTPPNTSMLAPTKWVYSSGDLATYYAQETCQKISTTTVGGEHLEWDTDHHLSGNDLFGFGVHYDWSTQKLYYCPQNCVAWAAMNIVESNGTVHTTFNWPANDWIYTQIYEHRTPSCSSSSGSNCMFYDYACYQDYTAGTGRVCGNLVDATSGLTPGGIPVSLPSWTRNQFIKQHQIDILQANGAVTATVDFDNLVAYNLSGTPTICYTTDGSTPTANGAGTCTHGTTYSGAITVSTTTTVKAIASASGFLDSSVATAIYTINGTLATPTFSPVAGSYGAAQTVTISGPVGATICWTNDGSTPTSSPAGTCSHGTTYVGTIIVSTTQTLKTIATQSLFTDSAVGSAAYTINGAADTPTFSPVAGTYSGTQSVTISSTTSGSTLCYTTDGSNPTGDGAGTCTHGTTYSGPVSVAFSLTLKAIASKSGFLDSFVGSAAYTISPSGGGGTTITGVGTLSGTVIIQ